MDPGLPSASLDRLGARFDKPFLAPYEAEVALGTRVFEPVYPMDYYPKAGGSYANYATERRAPDRWREQAAPVMVPPPAAEMAVAMPAAAAMTRMAVTAPAAADAAIWKPRRHLSAIAVARSGGRRGSGRRCTMEGDRHGHGCLHGVTAAHAIATPSSR